MIEKTPLFTQLSKWVWSGGSSEDAEKFPELFENVHMLLFGTMVLFIFQAIFMVYSARTHMKKWHAAEQLAADPIANEVRSTEPTLTKQSFGSVEILTSIVLLSEFPARCDGEGGR